MSLLDKLIESLLAEEAALTKGSQRVMNDKKLVAALADAVRDDAQSNPAAFPPGSKRNFQNAEDEAVAKWFLENIDRIEREGYEGVVYSRDGVNSDWIVRRYIAGSHSWEDLTGVMNMNLNDWYQLKNRNMLDANHKDLPKFNSVRDVGYYMTTHYKNQLDKVRDAAKNAARNKMAKSLKLVDNDDYRIYTTLNRAAGCALGLGTQWCTANSNYGGHFHSYSSRAMLFQIFPYTGETDEEGKKVLADNEKYQFDAGGPNFMDITDRPVKPEVVREKFPYLFSDLSKALQTNKAKMEKGFEELSNDPTLQGEDFKIKKYEIDQEIEKLHKFVDRGYMTDEVRPSKTSAEEPSEQPTVSAPPAQQPQGPQMESIKQLAQTMLEEVTLGHIVQQYKPLADDNEGEESPLTHGDDLSNTDEGCGCDQQDPFAMQLGEEEPMPMDGGNEIGAQAPTSGIGSAGGSSMGGGAKYAPGTAPTMPESVATEGYSTLDLWNMSPKEVIELLDAKKITYDDFSAYQDLVINGGPDENDDYTDYSMRQGEMGNPDKFAESQQKEPVMENVDKDVAAMLQSLKKYDKLNESVLGMLTVSMDKSKVAEAQLPPPPDEVEVDKDLLKEKDKDEELDESGPAKHEVPAAFRKEKGGDWKTSTADLEKDANKSPTTKKGLEDLKAKKDIKEEADADVLAWMSRFSKLGK